MLTVACVLSTSDGRRQYDASHVERLREMVAKHLSTIHRFVCLSDVDVPCEKIDLTEDRIGWWAKIELFRPGLFEGRVLYLDLDVTVVGELDEIAHYPEPFAAIKDWLRPTINSSVMVWDVGVMDHVFLNLSDDDVERLHGDQDWITEQMPEVKIFPREWCVSYRKSVVPLRRFMLPGQSVAVPPGAKIVVFHGFPKPWEVPTIV